MRIYTWKRKNRTKNYKHFSVIFDLWGRAVIRDTTKYTANVPNYGKEPNNCVKMCLILACGCRGCKRRWVLGRCTVWTNCDNNNTNGRARIMWLIKSCLHSHYIYYWAECNLRHSNSPKLYTGASIFPKAALCLPPLAILLKKRREVQRRDRSWCLPPPAKTTVLHLEPPTIGGPPWIEARVFTPTKKQRWFQLGRGSSTRWSTRSGVCWGKSTRSRSLVTTFPIFWR